MKRITAANENSSTSNDHSQKAKTDWTERLKLVNKQLAQACLMMQKSVPAYEVLTAISSDLLEQGFTDDQIAIAITRVTRECDWLTPKAIIERIPGGAKDDGRPGVEQAWTMCPKTEDESTVWTDEMAIAFGSARRLLLDGDSIGARMAFKEVYAAEVERARAEGRPVKWNASLGWDSTDRVRALSEAVLSKRIATDYALNLLAPVQREELLGQLPTPERKMLTGESRQQVSGIAQILQHLRENKSMPDELQPPPPKPERKELSPAEWAEKKRLAKEQLAKLGSKETA